MPRETQIVGLWCFLGDSSTTLNQCCRSKLHNPHVRAPDRAKVMLKTELMQMLRCEFALDWGGIHGSPHWTRVQLNGLQMARENGAQLDVVECFALLRDSQRMHDGKDGNHGARAADYARRINRDLLRLDAAGLESIPTQGNVAQFRSELWCVWQKLATFR